MTNDTPETTPKAAAPAVQRVTFFDAARHKRVQKWRTGSGIWTDLGLRFGGLLLRVRQINSRHVQIAREALEQEIRRQTSNDAGPLTPEESRRVDAVAVKMAVTGARGAIAATEESSAAAKKHKLKTATQDGIDLVIFDGSEDVDAVRDALIDLINGSEDFSMAIIRAANRLKQVTDAEIDAVGEGFVFGQHAPLELED